VLILYGVFWCEISTEPLGICPISKTDVFLVVGRRACYPEAIISPHASTTLLSPNVRLRAALLSAGSISLSSRYTEHAEHARAWQQPPSAVQGATAAQTLAPTVLARALTPWPAAAIAIRPEGAGEGATRGEGQERCPQGLTPLAHGDTVCPDPVGGAAVCPRDRTGTRRGGRIVSEPLAGARGTRRALYVRPCATTAYVS